MRLLITGSTAQQVSAKTRSLTPTFSSLVADSIKDDIDVCFVDPTGDVDLPFVKSFDSVLVGIAPPTSISANKVLPAMHIADLALEAGNLRLFVDAPEPSRITAAVSSVVAEPDRMVGQVHSRKLEYFKFVSDDAYRARVQNFLSYLHSGDWGPTLFPSLPWATENQTISRVTDGGLDAKPISVDRLLSCTSPGYVKPSGGDFWTCDIPSSQWAEKMCKTLTKPVLQTRRSKWEPESETLSRVQNSCGTLIATHRSDEPWWSPWIARSLGMGVPVATNWRLSKHVGSFEWMVLPQHMEEMDAHERFLFADLQLRSYLYQSPDLEQSKQIILKSLFD